MILRYTESGTIVKLHTVPEVEGIISAEIYNSTEMEYTYMLILPEGRS